MMGGAYLFVALPRVRPLQENQAELDPKTQIFRCGENVEKNITYQIHDIRSIVQQAQQAGYTTDGHFKSQSEHDDAFRTDLNFFCEHQWCRQAPSEVSDIVNPFGDNRAEHIGSVWYIDFRIDQIHYVNRRTRRSLRISILQERFVEFKNFERAGQPVPLLSQQRIMGSHRLDGRWKPAICIDPRVRNFAHRTFRDLDLHWRHVLRAEYSDLTLRVFARAVLCLATLNYQVREEKGLSGFVDMGMSGSIMTLPSWTPLKKKIVPLQKSVMFVCRSFEEGIEMVQKYHTEDQTQHAGAEKGEIRTPREMVYIVCTVRAVLLCHCSSDDELEFTPAAQLFNGSPDTLPPSDMGLDYLLWATSADRLVVSSNPIQELPAEIQDWILRHVSLEPVAAERVGCILKIGTPFSWQRHKRASDLGSPSSIHTHSLRILPESQIWIGGHNSGIAYFDSAEESKLLFPKPYPSVGIPVSSIENLNS